jgi:hypothetical protein
VLFDQSSDLEYKGAAARSGDLGLEAGGTGEWPAFISHCSAEVPMLQFSEEYGREGERRPIVHGVKDMDEIVRFFTEKPGDDACGSGSR